MVDSVETRVALMERDVAVSTTVLARLETTVERIGEVASNVAKILAVHDAKLEQAEQNNAELYRLSETRRSEMQEEISTVNSNIDKLRREVGNDLAASEAKILDAINKHRDDLKKEKDKDEKERNDLDTVIEKRIRALENWRWMLVGAGIVLGFILGKVPTITEAVFKASHIAQ
jgi:hypothetical protein